jgi:hypothetical protein
MGFGLENDSWARFLRIDLACLYGWLEDNK